MTEPGVPDISRPASFGGFFGALTPAGTDTGKLMESLKASRMAEVAWCRDCSRPHSTNIICPERADREREKAGAATSLAAASEADLPADPFTPGKLAAAATKDWYDDLLDAGIPLASVERILGSMLAAAAETFFS